MRTAFYIHEKSSPRYPQQGSRAYGVWVRWARTSARYSSLWITIWSPDQGMDIRNNQGSSYADLFKVFVPQWLLQFNIVWIDYKAGTLLNRFALGRGASRLRDAYEAGTMQSNNGSRGYFPSFATTLEVLAILRNSC
jgi:hypothetical protein